MSMIHLVQRRGRTILFSSHILADVERVADRIGILVDGVLRVDCPTEHFKESVSKLVLEFPGRPPAFPGCAGLVQAWEVGRRLELVIVHFGAEQRQVVESLAPLDWDVVGLNLEDAFVDYTRGPRRSLPVFGEELTPRSPRPPAIEEPHDHDRAKSSLLRQLLLAATLATGFGTVWCAVVVWLGTSIQEAWRAGTRRLENSSWSSPTARPDQQHAEQRPVAGDLSRPRGPPSRRSRTGRGRSPQLLSGERGTTGFLYWPLSWERRLKVFVNDREPTVNWFFVHDGKPQGSGYFVGYEKVSNRRVGFIGLAGFRAQPCGPPSGFRCGASRSTIRAGARRRSRSIRDGG